MTVTSLTRLLFSEFKPPAYLSGPMTGYHNMNKDTFASAKEFIEKHFGIEVYSPHEAVVDLTNKPDGYEVTWVDWMKADIMMLMKCNMVITLEHWEMSRGCRLEVDIAHRLGMLVVPFKLLYEGTLP